MRFLKPTLIAVTAIGLSFPLVSMTDRKPGAPTAYEAELSRIQKDISDLKDGASSAPSDMEKAARYVHRIYERALLTGSYADLHAAKPPSIVLSVKSGRSPISTCSRPIWISGCTGWKKPIATSKRLRASPATRKSSL